MDEAEPTAGAPGAAESAGESHDEVLRRIRAAILHGEFAPGQRLIEADLVRQFDSNRAHVRFALVVLANEGLVERNKYRGAQVVRVSLEEALEITEVRGVLEGLCAARAARRMTAERKESLRTLGQEMQRAVDAAEFLAYSDLNRQCHTLIQQYSGNRAANQMLERLRGRSGVSHQFHLALQPGRSRDSLSEHLAVMEAVISEDPDRAERAMRAHLQAVSQAVTKAYELAEKRSSLR